MAETTFEMTPETRLSLPVLPLKNTVVYPELVLPLTVGRVKSLAALKAATDANQRMITIAQRDPTLDDPDRADLYEIGTIVAVKRIERRDGGAQVIVQGEGRVRILDTLRDDPHLEVEYVKLPDLSVRESDPDAPRIHAMVRENQDLARRIAMLWDEDNGEQVFQQLVGSISDPVLQMFRIASLAQLDLQRLTDEWMAEIEAAAEELDAMLANLRAVVEPGSPLLTNLEKSLHEISIAAAALGELADYLQQNPSALLRGKDVEGN